MKQISQLFIVILIVTTCWKFGLATDEQPDFWPTKGWRTASPESQGVDPALLVDMLETIREHDYDINSVLVIRNGYIVLDAYGFPFKADYERHIQSCSKSVISALVGIAIDQGYIKDINQPLLHFFRNMSSRILMLINKR